MFHIYTKMLVSTGFYFNTHCFCRDHPDQLDLLAKMDQMDSLAPLDRLDLVGVLEKLVLLYVTLAVLFQFCLATTDCTCSADQSIFPFLPSFRVLLVTPDLLALLVPLALASTCLPSLVWVRLRSPLILSGT